MKTSKHIFLAAAMCLCIAFGANAAYNGTPVTPSKITSANYAKYGFTAETYSAYNGWYAISTAEELYGFAKLVNGGTTSANGVLTADIVVNENVLTADGELNGTPKYSWIPIGASKNFTGNFDGQGHTIRGLYFNNTNSSGGHFVGLFGLVGVGTGNNIASVSNVGIVDSYFKAYQSVGAICGFCAKARISNCYNAGTIIGINGQGWIGGICGDGSNSQNNRSYIINCYNTGMVKGNADRVGGICGRANDITNCYNTGLVIGDKGYVGGVVGSVLSSGSDGESLIANNYYLAGCAKDGEGKIQNGIGNSKMGQTTDDISGSTISATAEEFASGKIAYLLNGSVSECDLVWYQTLFSDAAPVLDPTHNRVTGYVDEADNVITVYGNLMIASGYEIAEGKTFVVPEGASVTIAEGVELINNGTITINGIFVANGTVYGNEIEGSGNFTYTNLSDNDIEIASAGYTYKGSAYTFENGLSDIVKTRTICGKQFSFDATGYTVSYENNTNVGDNAKIIWTGSSTVEKTFSISPNKNVTVTITGNSNTVTYNTEQQTISGYTVDIEDATGVYTENDIAFDGTAAASGTIVGAYSMGLSADDFSNTNTNFADVQFVVTDGVLTISKAENAPDMPTAIETYYINTQRVTLPDNWQWVENIALEKGENTAAAKYVGTDAGNYENERSEVTITRTACPHNEGHTTINVAEPTCTEEGNTGDHLCNICNEIFEQGESIEALGHTNGVAVFENEVAATCAAAGSRDSVVYCTVCQAEVSRTKKEIAQLAHTEVVDVAVAPSCTTAGKTEGKHCSVCNAVIVAQEEIPALGHLFKTYTFDNNATTEADGTETAVCEHGCGTTDTRVAAGTKLPEKATAVSESAAQQVSIYAHHNIIVVENADAEINVYNAMGALVATANDTNAEIRINVSGVYVVRVGKTAKRVMISD